MASRDSAILSPLVLLWVDVACSAAQVLEMTVIATDMHLDEFFLGPSIALRCDDLTFSRIKKSAVSRVLLERIRLSSFSKFSADSRFCEFFETCRHPSSELIVIGEQIHVKMSQISSYFPVFFGLVTEKSMIETRSLEALDRLRKLSTRRQDPDSEPSTFGCHSASKRRKRSGDESDNDQLISDKDKEEAAFEEDNSKDLICKDESHTQQVDHYLFDSRCPVPAARETSGTKSQPHPEIVGKENPFDELLQLINKVRSSRVLFKFVCR